MKSRRVLVARLDNLGDVLLAGPCVRAVAAHADHLTVLAGPHGRGAAELLPGVDEVLSWCAPWIDPGPAPLEPAEVDDLVTDLRERDFDAALRQLRRVLMPLERRTAREIDRVERGVDVDLAPPQVALDRGLHPPQLALGQARRAAHFGDFGRRLDPAQHLIERLADEVDPLTHFGHRRGERFLVTDMERQLRGE